MSDLASCWVATRFGGKILLTEVLLRPGRVFTVNANPGHTLITVEGEKRVTLGAFLGFALNLESLKENLAIDPGEEVLIVPVKKGSGDAE